MVDAGRSDRIVEEIRRGTEGGEEDEDDDNDEDEDEDNDGVVGAAAVVIHERPVVLQAPVISRPFMKQAPHFLKTAGQQPNKLSTSQASQLQRPDETLQSGTSQAPHSARVRPTEKSGTLQLGACCYN